MIVINNNFCTAERLCNKVIKLEVKTGVNVSRETASKTIQQIVNIMDDDFAILINRVNDYSVDPVSIFSYLNTIEQLKAFAIVVHRDSYLDMIPLQQDLLEVPLEGFLTVRDAHKWLKEIFNHCDCLVD